MPPAMHSSSHSFPTQSYEPILPVSILKQEHAVMLQQQQLELGGQILVLTQPLTSLYALA